MPRSDTSDPGTSTAQVVRRSLQLGAAIALPLSAFLLIGRWLDVRFETSPLFLLMGLGLSLVVTSVVLVRVVRGAAHS